MAKFKVYVTRRIPDKGLRLLDGKANYRVWDGDVPPSREVLCHEVREADGLISLLSDSIDSEILSAGKRLKVISNYAVGYNNIDVTCASSMGIKVTNTPGVLTETTADLAFALLMAAARRIVEADHFVRDGKWRSWGPKLLLGQDIYGATLGIIGLGAIGAAVARRAVGFGMKVCYYSRTRKKELERDLDVEFLPLEDLFRKSDYISIHCPLLPETEGLVGEDQLASMKKTAILVNTSRGRVVDQKALYRALAERRIAAAGLDVFEEEPILPGDPLLKLENVVVLPHIGSASVRTRERMAVMAVRNLLAVLEGGNIPNAIN